MVRRRAATLAVAIAACITVSCGGRLAGTPSGGGSSGDDAGASSTVGDDEDGSIPTPPSFDSGFGTDGTTGVTADASIDAGAAADAPLPPQPPPLLESGAECAADSDCEALLGPLPSICDTCPDGGTGCEHYICVWGICQPTLCASAPTSPPGTSGECVTESDCDNLLGSLPSICDTCPDGSAGCLHYACVTGLCQTTFCSVNPAQLLDSGAECAQPGDCETLLGPLPSICNTCSDGSSSCDHYFCLAGVCRSGYCENWGP